VTGIAGALTNNLHRIAGVGGGWSPDSLGCQLYAFKVSDAEGAVSTSAVAEAIRDAWPEYGVQVLNASLGGYNYSETLRAALCSHYRCAGILVAAKGNDGIDDWHYPSDYDASWVISVGATDRYDNRASWSNFGNGIDLVAPGVSIWSDVRTVHDPPYGSKSGTSMAAPHVTGTVGLVLSCDWWQYPEDIQGVIRAAADEVPPPADPNPGYDDYYGDGRLNTYRAVLFSGSAYAYDRYRQNGGSVVGITDWFTMRYDGESIGDLRHGYHYKVKRYEVRKDILYDPPYFVQGPYVWGVGEGQSTGWSAANPNLGVGYSSVVSGSESSEGCTLRTYVYDVRTMLGTPLGWYPCAPGEAYVACTVLGSFFGSVGEELPVERRVTTSHPNPCAREARIGYSLVTSSWVKIAVYDVAGRRVNILADAMRAAGEHSVVWNGQDSSGREVGSGIYFYRFETADRTETGRMVWVR